MIPNWLWQREWVRSSDGYLSYGGLALVIGIVVLLGLLSAWACLVLV